MEKQEDTLTQAGEGQGAGPLVDSTSHLENTGTVPHGRKNRPEEPATLGGHMTALTQLLRQISLAGLGFLALALPAAAQEKPIRIGVLYDLSGPFAAAGSVASSICAQIAIDLTNATGGVLCKYKVDPVNADSQSKADVAINEAERLITQEHVDIILGIYSSAHAVPIASKVEEQKKILWITTAVATSVFKDKNLKYVFRAQIHSDQYGQAGIGFLADHANARLGVQPKDLQVAIVYEDGPYGTGV